MSSRLPRITRRGKVGVSSPIQFSLSTIPAITSNTRIDIEANSVVIQNTGDETVTIEGQFTLSPGQSLSFGTNEDWNFFSLQMKFTFSGGGVNPRVEIMTVQAAIEGYGNLEPY